MKYNLKLLFSFFLIFLCFIVLDKKKKRIKEKEDLKCVLLNPSNLFLEKMEKTNLMNNIEYRVKWAMGIWYDKNYYVDNNNKYLINSFKKYLHYPEVSIIMNRQKYFLYSHGDVNTCINEPCITKTRPINCQTNIICLLEYKRHWENVFKVKKQDIDFDSKKNICFWRGTNTGMGRKEGNRFSLVKKWYNHPFIDVGFNFICTEEKNKYKKYLSQESSIYNSLKYKYLISAEGNDVASGLKWMLYSNSLVLMPKPTIVSWFMEDHLVPYVHYVPIKDDWSDLEEKYNWCQENPKKCILIVKNANIYVQRFINEFNFGLASKIMEEIINRYYNNIKFNRL